MNYDVIIAGCGFSGAVIANRMAAAGKKVLIVEKRDQIGGNMYDYADDKGVLVHLYGPHIFHTSDKAVFDYLEPFADWFDYRHRVIGRIDGKLVPIPFNFKSIDILFDQDKAKELKTLLKENFPGEIQASIFDLLNHENKKLKNLGEFVFEKIFLHYTAKQWGTPIDQVDQSVINRVPVRLNEEDGYFFDTIQKMPLGGFTKLFHNMLASDNIEIRLSTDIADLIKLDYDSKTINFENKPFGGIFVYTGALDELMDCKFGRLPYRSVDMQFETVDKTWYQSNSVVNYPNEEEFTRITEFKYLNKQDIEGHTVILKEYPAAYDPNAEKGNTPYYPITAEENAAKFKQYKDIADSFPGMVLCGRLAEYRYYNMDAAVARALQISDELLLK